MARPLESPRLDGDTASWGPFQVPTTSSITGNRRRGAEASDRPRQSGDLRAKYSGRKPPLSQKGRKESRENERKREMKDDGLISPTPHFINVINVISQIALQNGEVYEVEKTSWRNALNPRIHNDNARSLFDVT